MTDIREDRAFFYLLLLLITIITLILIWPYIGSVVLAITFAVLLQPMHNWFRQRVGGRKGIATALTMATTFLLVIIPAIIAALLMLDAFVSLSAKVTEIMQQPNPPWLAPAEQIDQWLSSTGVRETLQLPPETVTQAIRNFVNNAGGALVQWLASAGRTVANLGIPIILFISLLGTILTNEQLAVKLYKRLSPLDDGIDQLFLDRTRIMTKSMMYSIVVVAIVQGIVTGLFMALGGTPHVIPLTLLATLLSILPGGAVIVSIPVGIVHLLLGNTWGGLLVLLGPLMIMGFLANRVRPMMVSKDAYLNRSFVLLSVFSGMAVFGFMGIVYGPIIMILFTTVLGVYLKYYYPGSPSVVVDPDDLKMTAEDLLEKKD
jgi:predicted PurR-regulated permease PerM